MPQLSTVLWDLDDTLINTTATRLKAQENALKTILKFLPSDQSVTLEQITIKVERLVSLFGSTYYVQYLSLLCKDLSADSVFRQHLSAVGCQAFREVFGDIAAVDGAKETLQALLLSGYKLGLVSNGLFPFQMEKLRCAGLDQYFEQKMIFISSHYYRRFGLPPDLNSYSRDVSVSLAELEVSWLKNNVEKPWPHMLNLALEACGCPANQIIYVGNRTTDIVPARLAGMWAVLVNDPFRPKSIALLSFEQPDFAIDNVTEIFSVIHQIEKQ